MSKDSGLGDLLYLDGRNLSGDIGAINEISGGPAVVDTTHVTSDGLERIGTTLSGQLVFDAYFNPTGAHPPLSALPTADVVSTYLRGSAPDAATAGLIGRQVDYPGSSTAAGDLHFAITVTSDNSAGVEWGRGYVGGPTRTDTAPTTGAGVDDGAGTAIGLTAYLHVLAFTGTSAIIAIEHSADNGVTDPWSTLTVFNAVTTAPAAQRIATAVTLAVKRWLRVRTGGIFSNLLFHVMALRQSLAAVGASVATDSQIFTASGTWTKPAGCNYTMAVCIAGGNGGGSGACTDGVTNTASGGGAGGGGGYSWAIYPTASLNATEPVTIGAGGTGPAGTSSANASGTTGGGGGATIFGSGPSKCIALGAAQGNASSKGLPGVINAGSGNTGQAVGSIFGGTGIGSSTAGAGPLGLTGGGTAGGGAGGSVNNPAAAAAGGAGGSSVLMASGGSGAGTAGASGGGTGGAGTHPYPNEAIGGSGGGGGGSGIGGTNGGAGGAGAPHGGGGGGGGATVVPGTSGAGGAGGAGWCRVISW